MNCEKYRKKISALVDGELNDKERQIVERHLEVCPSCRLLEAELTRLQLQCRSLWKETEPGEDLSVKVMEELAGKKKRRVLPPFSRRIKYLMAVMVLAVAGMVAAGMGWHPVLRGIWKGLGQFLFIPLLMVRDRIWLAEMLGGAIILVLAGLWFWMRKRGREGAEE